jgi:hypothetical protein
MIWLYVIMNVKRAWMTVNKCEHWISISDYEWLWMTVNICEWLWASMNMIWITMNNYEHLWVTVNVYEHDMNDYEHWTNMNDCEIIEQSLWMVCECEQGVICEWEQGVIYEWEWKTIYEWKQGMICEWVWGAIKSKEKSMSEEWYMNDKHLWTICAFFVRLILCISWMTMFPLWLVPTNFKFRPIFPIEVQVHLESNASQLVKKSLSLSPIMKKKTRSWRCVAFSR